jgi:hypothetical protein
MSRLYKTLFRDQNKKGINVRNGKDLYFALRRNFRTPAVEAYRIAMSQ